MRRKDDVSFVAASDVRVVDGINYLKKGTVSNR